MIEETFAKKQLERMTGLKFFPKEGAAARELKLALMVAQIDSIAISVVDGIVAGMDEAPTPRLIREMCNDRNEQWEAEQRAKKRPAPPHCARCRDSGVIESIHADDFHSIASWCACEAGHRKRLPDGMGDFLKHGEDWVDCINRNRRKLKVLYNNTKPFEALRAGQVPEAYHGEF